MNKLRDLRKSKGLSLVAFARQMGVARQTVYNWENGTSPMNKAARHLAVHVLNVRAEDILGDNVNA